MSRRAFLGTAATLAAGITIVPRHVLGGPGYQAPSDTLQLAVVGVGGMGMSNMSKLLGERIVALCDADFGYVERSLASRLRTRPGANPQALAEARGMEQVYLKARRYTDFRQMLDRERGIDGVVVATPDHVHAAIAERAMRLGKHVFVQKPLAATVQECRMLARTARETKVVTQMGNQGHSGDGTRRIREIVQSGVLGPVREAHVWTDRPVRYWPQGIPRPGTQRPAGTPGAPLTLSDGKPLPSAPPSWNMRTVDDAVLAAMAANAAPPPGLDWDSWLGPVPAVPYHPAYHPFAWRGWVDFGVGAIGDMGAHLLDQVVWALDLGHPETVSASSSPWGGGAEAPASYPLAMTAEYGFAARGAMPAVRLHWYDGGLIPPRPPFLPDGETLSRGDGSGGVLVGERGILVYDTYGNNPRVFPEAVAAEAARVPQTIARIPVPHEVNWTQACKGQGQATSPFEIAAPLTELMLLPLVALRAGPGRLLRYDAAAMRFPNAAEADRWLTREYRAGWFA